MSIQKFLDTVNSENFKSVSLVAVDMQLENKVCNRFETVEEDIAKLKLFLSNDNLEFAIMGTAFSCPEIIVTKNGVGQSYKILEVFYSYEHDCFDLKTVINKKKGWKEFNFLIQFISN